MRTARQSPSLQQKARFLLWARWEERQTGELLLRVHLPRTRFDCQLRRLQEQVQVLMRALLWAQEPRSTFRLGRLLLQVMSA